MRRIHTFVLGLAVFVGLTLMGTARPAQASGFGYYWPTAYYRSYYPGYYGWYYPGYHRAYYPVSYYYPASYYRGYYGAYYPVTYTSHYPVYYTPRVYCW